MNKHSRSIIAILLTGVWVNASEFFRNSVLLKQYWIAHYQSLGMTFPSEPVNGMMWIAWGFLFSVAIFWISRKFSLLHTTLISWFMGFVLMWFVAWNLQVLPVALLVYAVPLSLLEAFVGSCICVRVCPGDQTT
jgi:hypothetical protein